MVHTYADGFGRWHAIVKDTRLGFTNAVARIADELAERECKAGELYSDVYARMLDYVNRNIVSIPDADSGYIHFAEYAIEEN